MAYKHYLADGVRETLLDSTQSILFYQIAYLIANQFPLYTPTQVVRLAALSFNSWHEKTKCNEVLDFENSNS